MTMTLLNYITPDLNVNQKVIIVGSSGKLSYTNLGNRIDSYDEVIRFNRAPTSGYETHVGSRTSLRVVNNHVFNNNDISKSGYSAQPAKFIKNLRNERILYIGPDKGPWHRRKENTNSSNELYLYKYENTSKIQKALNVVSSKQMTVGALIIGICILSDIKPTLVGFDLEPCPRTHYWETRPPKASQSHSPTDEQKWFKHLESEDKIEILK